MKRETKLGTIGKLCSVKSCPSGRKLKTVMYHMCGGNDHPDPKMCPSSLQIGTYIFSYMSFERV